MWVGGRLEEERMHGRPGKLSGMGGRAISLSEVDPQIRNANTKTHYTSRQAKK